MEHPVGKPFKVNGVFYVAVANAEDGWLCRCCVLRSNCPPFGGRRLGFGECAWWLRDDKCNVHFRQFGVDF